MDMTARKDEQHWEICKAEKQAEITTQLPFKGYKVVQVQRSQPDLSFGGFCGMGQTETSTICMFLEHEHSDGSERRIGNGDTPLIGCQKGYRMSKLTKKLPQFL